MAAKMTVLEIKTDVEKRIHFTPFSASIFDWQLRPVATEFDDLSI